MLDEVTRRRLADAESTMTSLDRIYYINLPHRQARRRVMEGWLGKQPVPFHRIEPLPGTNNPEQCTPGDARDPTKSWPERCLAFSSLARTVTSIGQDHNTTGLTLVLEDDVRIFKPLDEMLDVSLKLVPSDWDIIRWECSPQGYIMKPEAAPHWRMENVSAVAFQTVLPPECNDTTWTCWYCGGTHAMLWRGSSVDKLAKIWTRLPYDDIDCRLTRSAEIKSYCVNFDGGARVVGFTHTELPPEEHSDITMIWQKKVPPPCTFGNRCWFRKLKESLRLPF
jgi:GR25 family glycosyltransferase involved in LPS biosynthesis